MTVFDDPTSWLPVVFAALMGLSILVYVVLDGFDIGVGVLLLRAEPAERDRMIASIGPFWDANETWLVLAVGLLLVAFPAAHGIILSALYMPTAVLLFGLILRGAAFEFRAKATRERKEFWDRAFFAGSAMTALSQGYMLGLYVMGLEWSTATMAFSALTGVCLAVGYALIGACWLVLKTEGPLQLKSIAWARSAQWGAMIGMGAVSLATPLVSPRIFDRWFAMPEIFYLAPLPLASLALFGLLWLLLASEPNRVERWSWAPFTLVSALMTLGFTGLAYSFYPYVVPDALTIYEAASAPESLFIILIGTAVVLPTIAGYTVLSYAVFRGKATTLRYD